MNKGTSQTRQALWIAIGSFASFCFSIVSSMILSRMLSKDDYGTYKQVMYVYNSLLVIFNLGLPQAFGYFLPRVEKNEGRAVVRIITNVLSFLGLIFSILLFISSSFIANILNNPELTIAIRIFSPVPLLLLPTLGLDSIYATYKQTHIASIYTLSTRLVLLICVVSPVFIFHLGYIGALWGFLFASVFNFILACYLKNRPFKGLDNKNTTYKYKDLFKFCLPIVVAAIWGMIINSVDQFFISRYFGTKVFAEFSNGAMELPFVGMIISACGTVLYPKFSQLNHLKANPKETIYPIWISVFKKTAMLIYPLVLFSWFFAEDIMVLLYGQKYILSGIYFKIKLLANLFTLISFAPVILSIGKTTYYAKVHMYNAIVLIILEYLSIKIFDNPYVLVGISVVCHIGRIFAMLTVVASYFQVSILQLFPMKIIAKIAIPSTCVLFVLKEFIRFNSVMLELLVAGVIYFLIFISVSKIIKLDYFDLFKQLVK